MVFIWSDFNELPVDIGVFVVDFASSLFDGKIAIIAAIVPTMAIIIVEAQAGLGLVRSIL